MLVFLTLIKMKGGLVMEEEERWAVDVAGTKFPGFKSEDEAKTEIDRRPEWRNRGAVATRLHSKKELGGQDSNRKR